MKAFSFEFTHVLLGMVSCLHILVAFAALFQQLDDHPIPDNIVCKMAMQAIDKFDLLPLLEKVTMLMHQC
jgi:hypothetical protein